MNGAVYQTLQDATAEIARVGGHYAVQGHSKSLIFVPTESAYVTSVINTNLHPIAYRLQVSAD